MTPHNWYQTIISRSSSADVIFLGIRQNWDLITFLLFDLGYLSENGGVVKISPLKFQNIEHNYGSDLNIHMSNMNPKGKTLQYCICRGDPLFQSPIKERNSNKKNYILSTGLRYYNTVDVILRSKLVEHTAFMNRKNMID